MRRKHEHDLNEQLSTAQSEYLSNVAGLTGSLSGLSAALEARASGDGASVSAQKLWLACTSLQESIKIGNSSAETLDETIKPLKSDISSIKVIYRRRVFS